MYKAARNIINEVDKKLKDALSSPRVSNTLIVFTMIKNSKILLVFQVL